MSVWAVIANVCMEQQMRSCHDCFAKCRRAESGTQAQVVLMTGSSRKRMQLLLHVEPASNKCAFFPKLVFSLGWECCQGRGAAWERLCWGGSCSCRTLCSCLLRACWKQEAGRAAPEMGMKGGEVLVAGWLRREDLFIPRLQWHAGSVLLGRRAVMELSHPSSLRALEAEGAVLMCPWQPEWVIARHAVVPRRKQNAALLLVFACSGWTDWNDHGEWVCGRCACFCLQRKRPRFCSCSCGLVFHLPSYQCKSIHSTFIEWIILLKCCRCIKLVWCWSQAYCVSHLGVRLSWVLPSNRKATVHWAGTSAKMLLSSVLLLWVNLNHEPLHQLLFARAEMFLFCFVFLLGLLLSLIIKGLINAVDSLLLV